jgi:hypothetical protein
MVNVLVTTPKNAYQPSVNDSGCSILDNPRAMLRPLPIINILATFVGDMGNVTVGTPQNERQ